MKTYIFIFIVLALSVSSRSSAQDQAAKSVLEQLPRIGLSPDQTLHIISPEPVQYVDIASDRIIADLPLDNIIRLKLPVDSLEDNSVARGDTNNKASLGSISIVGENFIAQYHLWQNAETSQMAIPTRVDILPKDMQPLDIAGISLARSQMKQKALEIISRQKSGKPVRKSRTYGITLSLNGIYSLSDYIFIDLSVRNSSRLKYDPDELRFFVQDKKITKATNVQSIELTPLYALHPLAPFARDYRNIYVLKKLSFPGSKILKIGLTEKQLSGRTAELTIKYKDLLDADSL